MKKQLSRKFKGKKFYCEHIETAKWRAEDVKISLTKNIPKKWRPNVRIVTLSDRGQEVYGVFVRSK